MSNNFATLIDYSTGKVYIWNMENIAPESIEEAVIKKCEENNIKI